MCIFCDRAKASLEDPLAVLDISGDWDGGTSASGRGSGSRSSFRKRDWGATLRQKREAERCEELRRKARLPVTVITGFLGAGKTTFVNHLLSARHGRRLAVIENEFGEVPIDDALLGDGGVERGEEAQQVILMPNGCMCCRVRGDLVNAVKRLIMSDNSNASGEGTGDAQHQRPNQQQDDPSGIPLPDGETTGEGTDAPPVKSPASAETGGKSGGTVSRSSLEGLDHKSVAAKENPARGTVPAAAKLDGIILECSGLDELAPVLQTFFADPFVQEHVRLDAVVCLCDSPRLLPMLLPSLSPSPPPPSASGEASTTRDEAGANCLKLSQEDVDETGDTGAASAAANLVMSQLALSDRVLLNKSDLITRAEGDALVDAVKERLPGALVTRCERGQVDVDLVLGVDSFSLDRALEMDQQFADILADGKNEHDTGEDHDHHHLDEIDGKKPVRRHGHERLGAASVGVELAEAPLDWSNFTAWLKGFLEREGEGVIWRMKGVLWTTAPPGLGDGGARSWGWGAGRRTVVQGLYGHFESEVSDWPGGTTRSSRMVFIGDLSPRVKEALRAGVRSCVATPRARLPPPKSRLDRSSATTAGRSSNGFASRLGSVKFGGGACDADMLL